MKNILVLSGSLMALSPVARVLCIGSKEEDIPDEIFKAVMDMEIFDKDPTPTTSRNLIIKVAEAVPSPEPCFLEKRQGSFPKIPPKKMGSPGRKYRVQKVFF